MLSPRAMRTIEKAAAAFVVWGLPLLLVATSIATKAMAPEFPGNETRFFRVMQTAPDLFNVAKVVVLTGGMAAICGAVFLWGALVGMSRGAQILVSMARAQRPRRASLVAALALAALVVLGTGSILASAYPRLARLGFWDHFEGAKVYACYFAIFVLAWACARLQPEVFRRSVLTGAIAASLLVTAVGACQYLGASPWEWPLFGASTVVPVSGVRIFSTWGKGTFSSTLYNPNWAGLFFSLMAPFSVFVFSARTPAMPKQAARWKGTVRSLVFGAWVMACALALSASGSRSAFLATAASLVAGVIFSLATRAGRAAFSAARMACALALFCLCVLNVTSHRGASVASDILTTSATNAIAVPVERFETRGDALAARWRGEGFTLLLRAPGELVMRDERGTIVPWREQDGVLHALHPALLGFAVQSVEGQGNVFVARLSSARVTVGFLPGGARVLHSGTWMRAGTPAEIPFLRWLPNGFASSRGYIWKRGVAIALSAPWLGVGPGAWADVFPQNDFAGKLRAVGTTDVTIEKPHNFFLGLAGAFGLPFLGLFLLIVGIALVRAFRAWIAMQAAWPLALCTASVSFLGAALFNDGSVGVSPFFFLLLGFGLGARKSLSGGARSNEPSPSEDAICQRNGGK